MSKVKVTACIAHQKPEECCAECKYLKYCYYTAEHICSIECKKGFKVVDTRHPFACGDFRLKRGLLL